LEALRTVWWRLLAILAWAYKWPPSELLDLDTVDLSRWYAETKAISSHLNEDKGKV